MAWLRLSWVIRAWDFAIFRAPLGHSDLLPFWLSKTSTDGFPGPSGNTSALLGLKPLIRPGLRGWWLPAACGTRMTVATLRVCMFNTSVRSCVCAGCRLLTTASKIQLHLRSCELDRGLSLLYCRALHTIWRTWGQLCQTMPLR